MEEGTRNGTAVETEALRMRKPRLEERDGGLRVKIVGLVKLTDDG